MGTHRLDGRPSPVSPLWHAADAALSLSRGCGRREEVRVADLFAGQPPEEHLWRAIARLRCGCGRRPTAEDPRAGGPRSHAWSQRLTIEQAAREGQWLRPRCLSCCRQGQTMSARSLVDRYGSLSVYEAARRMRCTGCGQLGQVGVHVLPAER